MKNQNKIELHELRTLALCYHVTPYRRAHQAAHALGIKGFYRNITRLYHQGFVHVVNNEQGERLLIEASDMGKLWVDMAIDARTHGIKEIKLLSVARYDTGRDVKTILQLANQLSQVITLS